MMSKPEADEWYNFADGRDVRTTISILESSSFGVSLHDAHFLGFWQMFLVWTNITIFAGKCIIANPSL